MVMEHKYAVDCRLGAWLVVYRHNEVWDTFGDLASVLIAIIIIIMSI